MLKEISFLYLQETENYVNILLKNSVYIKKSLSVWLAIKKWKQFYALAICQRNLTFHELKQTKSAPCHVWNKKNENGLFTFVNPTNTIFKNTTDILFDSFQKLIRLRRFGISSTFNLGGQSILLFSNVGMQSKLSSVIVKLLYLTDM